MVFVIHWQESVMDLHVLPIPIPPPTSLSTRSLWVFPVHQPRALVSCIQPGLVICFTLDNIHVSMLFSWNIPPSPSPTESTSLFYTSVSLRSEVILTCPVSLDTWYPDFTTYFFLRHYTEPWKTFWKMTFFFSILSMENVARLEKSCPWSMYFLSCERNFVKHLLVIQ